MRGRHIAMCRIYVVQRQEYSEIKHSHLFGCDGVVVLISVLTACLSNLLFTYVILFSTSIYYIVQQK